MCDEDRGRCDCEPGWAGDGCEQLAPACPRNCSGHGECRRVVLLDATKSVGRCVCERGFRGEGCEEGDAYGSGGPNSLPPFHSRPPEVVE